MVQATWWRGQVEERDVGWVWGRTREACVEGEGRGGGVCTCLRQARLPYGSDKDNQTTE